MKDKTKKIESFDNEDERLSNACKISLLILENIWKDIKSNNLENSQFVLNWLDSLNEISIRN